MQRQLPQQRSRQAAQLQPRIKPPPEMKPKYLEEHEKLLESKLPARRSDPVVSDVITEEPTPSQVEDSIPSRAPVITTDSPRPVRPAQPAQLTPAPKQPKAPSTAPVKRQRAKIAPAIPIVQSPLTAEQRSNIQRYITLDNEVAQLKSRTKELIRQRDQLETIVSAIIKPLAAPVKDGNTTLRIKVGDVKETLTKDKWVQKLAASGELKDPAKSQELVDNIYKSLVVTKTKEELVTTTPGKK